ncbi:hypothetical protein [Halorussus lipolyticus]|uniref:hypothetical protein n=1 Tax=Halorussus lipolyticus TaxID=3034024 RepID=UPI0023E86EFA|nr:hypothetical protein [Halorussus sp. DT80]
MSTNTSRSQESTGSATGPHDGRDSDGDVDHRYWRCERCGLESTDPRLSKGCFWCGSRRSSADDGSAETPARLAEESDG